MDDVATEVALYPVDTAEYVSTELRREPFRRYLRTSKGGPVAIGDEWSEVVNDGCGSTTPVVLRVVDVEGGTQVGEETTFVFEA